MTVIADISGLYALVNRKDPHHMKAEHPEAFSFDHHFTQMGLARVP
jgi:hypothetical protein